MDIEVLEVAPREAGLTAKSLRRSGFIPAEYYGHGKDNVSLQMDYQAFRKLYRRAGENTVIELQVGEDGKTKMNVLVHHIDLHPVTDEIVHVDFINVNMDEEVHTKIPLTFVGTSPAVKELGGIFSAHYHDVEIKCLPKHLVHDIEVDISSLTDFSKSLHFSDIQLPEGITLAIDEGITVCTVSQPRIEKEPEPGEVGGEVAEGEAAEGGDAPAEGTAEEGGGE